MQGPIFSAAIDNIAVSAIQDLFEIATDATTRIAICGIDLFQNTDFGDAQAETLALRIIRGLGTTGSGGSAVTPKNHKPWSRVSPCTVARNNTTPAVIGAGTSDVLLSTGFNVQAGFFYRPRWVDSTDVDERIFCEKNSRIVVNLPAAPADSITVFGTIWWQELGLFSG